MEWNGEISGKLYEISPLPPVGRNDGIKQMNMSFPLIKNTSQGSRLLIFTLLLIFGLIFSTILGVLIAMMNGEGFADFKNLQITQILSQVIGIMMPAVVYVMLVKEKPFNYLGFKKIPTWSLLGVVAMFAVIPFLSMVTDWNDCIVFPESMRSLEEQLRLYQEKAEEIGRAHV